jgi:hypothetical protein
MSRTVLNEQDLSYLAATTTEERALAERAAKLAIAKVVAWWKSPDPAVRETMTPFTTSKMTEERFLKDGT